MARCGSGTGAPWNLRVCCWGGFCVGRIACLGPRPAGSPRARRALAPPSLSQLSSTLSLRASARSSLVLASWLLLLFCCTPRCNRVLRLLPLSPRQSSQLLMTSLLRTACPASGRPVAPPGVGRCKAASSAWSVYVLRPPSPLLRIGRLGPIACLFWKGKRLLLRAVLPHLSLPEAHAPSLQAAAAAALVLVDPSWEPPTWQNVLAGALPATRSDDADSLFLSGDAARGWQRRAWKTVFSRTCPSTLTLLRWRCWSRSRGPSLAVS